MQRFRVLISGSAGHWVNSIRQVFVKETYFIIVDADESQDLIAQINAAQPEVVVLLVETEADKDRLEVLLQQRRHINLVLVVDNPYQFDLFAYLQQGVCGILPVRLLPCQIVHAVELIVLGGIVSLPRMNPEHYTGFMTKPKQLPDLFTLREREIIALIRQNYSNKEIAAALCLAESTVKTHLHNVFKKMGVRGRNEVLAALMERGQGTAGELSSN